LTINAAENAGENAGENFSGVDGASRTTPETTLEKILVMLRAEPTMTRHELARRIGITLDGLRYQLRKLKAARRIRHVGPIKAETMKSIGSGSKNLLTFC
jgi:predicted HTH transcriptional regulator